MNDEAFRSKDLLTIEDVALILSRSINGVRKMRQLGHLPPAVPIGNRLYWRAKKFFEWVDSLEEPDDFDYGQVGGGRRLTSPRWSTSTILSRARVGTGANPARALRIWCW